MMPDMMIAQRYQIQSVIGEGGTAIVYKAQCTVLNRTVALKMLKPEFCKDESFIQRFNHEARAAAALSHQNIVGIFDVGLADNVPFIVMEYVDGTDLKTLIQEKGRMAETKVRQIALQLLSAVDYAHRKGIIHRDIKPHNILLTGDGIVKVADFGIAKAVSDATLVHTGVVIGTVHYLSPEQARGGLIDARSDIYSTGVLLYELLSGKVPFDGDNPISIALMHIREEAVPLKRLVPGISEKWDYVIMRAMEKEVGARFSSADEMRLAISSDFFQHSPAVQTPEKAISNVDKTVEIERSKMTDALERTERGHRNRIIFSPKFFLIVGLALVVLMGFLLLRLYLNVPEVKVPLVEGMAVSAAEETLSERGLQMNVEREINDEKVLPGTIIFQDIPAGTNVKKNTTVNVVISVRDGKMTMPDLAGMTKEVALKALEEAELRQGIISEAFSDIVEKGKVIEQSPLAGSIVYAGDKIDVVISKGVSPAEMVMPELVGLNVNNAKSILSQYNLNIAQVEDDYNPSFQKGQIVRQQPVAGDLINEGSGIKVWVHNDTAGGSRGIRITVPEGLQGSQIVRAVLNDSRGSNEVYRMEHLAGDSISFNVNWFGNNASVSVYAGNNLLETINLTN
jgi:serine/threonine-protein kinase